MKSIENYLSAGIKVSIMNDEPMYSDLTAVEKSKYLQEKGLEVLDNGDGLDKPEDGGYVFVDHNGYASAPFPTPAVDRREMDRRAVKDDSGKLHWHLLPTRPLQELIKLLMFGAKKYEPHNWRRGFDYSRCFDALMRHLEAWWQGEDIDAESGCHHLSAVMFYAVILLEFHFTGTGRDDRRHHTSAITNQGDSNVSTG